MITINIAKEFTDTPGARYITDGPFSGEVFRKEKLEEHFENKNDDYPITIKLDGTEGYATSFLEEAFGGLARIYGVKRCLKRLIFISEEAHLLIDEVTEYIKDANE